MTANASNYASSSHSLVVYELQPPPWRLPLTCATQAYPEFYPGASALYPHVASISGQVRGNFAGQSKDAASSDLGIVGSSKAKEDDLSEAAVKTGFVNRPVVQVRSVLLKLTISVRLHSWHSCFGLQLFLLLKPARNEERALLSASAHLAKVLTWTFSDGTLQAGSSCIRQKGL